MPSLEIAHPQQDFPREDLSDSNAAILSLALANSGIVLSRHVQAEETYRVFKATHSSLRIAVDHLFDDPEDIAAIDHGMQALEAMAYMVRARHLKPVIPVLQTNVINFMKPKNSDIVQGYIQNAHKEFLGNAPNTAAVIKESAERHLGQRARLAVVGGAVARQFGLDNTTDNFRPEKFGLQ